MTMPSPRLLLSSALVLLLSFALAATAAEVEGLDSRYVTLDPIVVNMQDGERARYIQATVQLEGNSEEHARAVREHVPAIRDRLIRILGGRPPEAVRGGENREDLREEALQEIRGVLQELTGDPRITALYFSDFIRQ
ncbi:MAG: flagellar basal body-associated FliL family protein [Pseudomonadota bacterium]